jgi:hypothetical protein
MHHQLLRQQKNLLQTHPVEQMKDQDFIPLVGTLVGEVQRLRQGLVRIDQASSISLS